MGTSSSLRHKVLIAPLFLMVFCACEFPGMGGDGNGNLLAKDQPQACALLQKSLGMHNRPLRSGALFVPVDDDNLPREFKDKPGTVLVSAESGRHFQLFGPNGLFREQAHEIPQTMAKFGLAQIKAEQIQATVGTPFRTTKTNDGVDVVLDGVPNQTSNGQPVEAPLTVRITDVCGKSSTVNLILVLNDGSLPTPPAARSAQIAAQGGFGNSTGTTATSPAFVVSGSQTTGASDGSSFSGGHESAAVASAPSFDN